MSHEMGLHQNPKKPTVTSLPTVTIGHGHHNSLIEKSRSSTFRQSSNSSRLFQQTSSLPKSLYVPLKPLSLHRRALVSLVSFLPSFFSNDQRLDSSTFVFIYDASNKQPFYLPFRRHSGHACESQLAKVQAWSCQGR